MPKATAATTPYSTQSAPVIPATSPLVPGAVASSRGEPSWSQTGWTTGVSRPFLVSLIELHPHRDQLMKPEDIAHSPVFVAAAAARRRTDLDWIRIAVFAVLIFYHVGMLYVSWGFHIKSVHRITALEWLMLVPNPWRLALLFLVSGAATRFMSGKYAPGALLRARS